MPPGAKRRPALGANTLQGGRPVSQDQPTNQASAGSWLERRPEGRRGRQEGRLGESLRAMKGYLDMTSADHKTEQTKTRQ